MAKSIRSKSKRRNRTALRKVLCEPVIAARQKKVSKKLAESLKEKQGKSILGLKAIFQKKGKQDDIEQDVEDENEVVSMEEGNSSECDDENNAVEFETKKKNNRVQEKIKGRKAQNKERKSKKLVWF